MKLFLNKKENFLDKTTIKIKIMEFLKMTPKWVFLLILLGVTCYCFVFYNSNALITIIIIPLLISLQVSHLLEFIKEYIKKVNWTYKRASIYRDLLEIFSIIIVSMHRDFGNILEAPMFCGYFSLNDADKRLLELYNFANQRKQFVTNNYYLHNLKHLIKQMSNEYFSIISNACTESDIVVNFL